MENPSRISPGLKLNLGSGQDPMPGYVNVDKFGTPDVKWDLEVFPWPWEDSSVDAVLMSHVLEHLGQTNEVFFGIIKELYRVCRHGAQIHILVPHPRHDDFLSDPTHVRSFMPESFTFYSKAINREWERTNAANTPLGLFLDVDFTPVSVTQGLSEPWLSQLRAGKITEAEVTEAAKRYNNVVIDITVDLIVNKPPTRSAVKE
jgi:methyltransferase family protein